MKNFIYHNQIVHHKPCFNLFILHNNLFDNQGSKIKIKTNFFVRFDILPFTKTFFLLSTLLYSTQFSLPLSLALSLYIYINYFPSHVLPLTHKHARHSGTWARKHARHVGTWARKHAGYVGTWACKHAKHVGTWVRKARNLADSISIGYNFSWMKFFERGS